MAHNCAKYDDKTRRYICKERACESFYRMVELPEEVKADAAQANMKDGVIEVALPKKTPKQEESPYKITGQQPHFFPSLPVFVWRCYF